MTNIYTLFDKFSKLPSLPKNKIVQVKINEVELFQLSKPKEIEEQKKNILYLIYFVS